MDCVRCGTVLAEGDRVCPQCGSARVLVPRDFQELQQQAESLRTAFLSGAETEEDYRARFQGLMLSDPAEVHWKYDPETENWSCYQNGRWQNALPPHMQGGPPSPQAAPAPPVPTYPAYPPLPQAVTARKKPSWVLPVVLGGVLLLLGYTAFAWLMSGYQESQRQSEILQAHPPEDVLWTMALTDSQTAMRDYRGAPEAFTILFYQEEQEDGSILDVRLETWTYYSADTEVTFLNGELISEAALLDHPENVIPTAYRPEQFPYRLTALEVAQAAGAAEYLQVSLDEEFVENARVYVTSGLTWGVSGGKLIFVQAPALQGEVTP